MSDSVKQAIQTWCGQFVNAFKRKTGQTITIGSFKEAAFFDSASEDKWIEQKFSGASGTAWLYIPESTWETLAGLMAEGAAVEDGVDQNSHSSLVEAIAQSFSTFARSLSTHTGSTIEALTTTRRTSPPPEVEGLTAQVETTAGSGKIGFIFDADLTTLVARPESHLTAASRTKADGGTALDLLLDVELPITVLIGSTQMPLRDVLNLTTGSIVELDRLITDPVDLFVNRRLIARGEVVVIEGNYGVRILEVVSRSERLALRSGQTVAGRQNLRMEAGV